MKINEVITEANAFGKPQGVMSKLAQQVFGAGNIEATKRALGKKSPLSAMIDKPAVGLDKPDEKTITAPSSAAHAPTAAELGAAPGSEVTPGGIIVPPHAGGKARAKTVTPAPTTTAQPPAQLGQNQLWVQGHGILTKWNDGKWRDEAEEVIANPTDVRELERRLAIRQQAQQMAPAQAPYRMPRQRVR